MLNLNCHEIESFNDNDIISLFLSTKAHRSVHTKKNYQRSIKKFRKFIKYKSLNEVNWRDIVNYKLSLEKGTGNKNQNTYAPATIANLLASIRSLYSWGSDPNIGFFSKNPASTLKIDLVPLNSKSHFLTKKEIAALLTQLKKQSLRNYLIGLTLILTGLRVSELTAIRWSNFQLDPTETSVWLTVMNAKGGKQRQIKIPASLWELFLSSRGQASDDSRLFPLSVRQVERIIKKAQVQANIPKKITPHWLRHTNATFALINGATLQQVQENLGHAKLNTTQRYLHTVNLLNNAAPDFVENCLKDVIY